MNASEIFADLERGSVNVHGRSPKRPVEYYLKRLSQGHRAYRRGVRDTPLTRTLERWVDYQHIFQVGNYQIPALWKAYTSVLWEYIEAIDAEDELAHYRFQRVGEMWLLHFSVNGAVKQGIFKDHRGFQHYAKLLSAPDRTIESVELAGLADPDTLALIEDDRLYTDIERNDKVSRKLYKNALAMLKEQQLTARSKGDLVDMERLDEQIEHLTNELWPGGGKRTTTTLRRQTIRRTPTELKIHRTVGTAMRRSIETLRDERRMNELADFLERNVNPDGYGFAYRPISPHPEWLL